MVGYSVLIGVATLVGVMAFVYAVLYASSRGQILHGIRKRFFCDGKQRVVDVNFVEVNRNQYDVASCTAFAEDQTVSCDKHCVKVVEEDTARADEPGRAVNPSPAVPQAVPGSVR